MLQPAQTRKIREMMTNLWKHRGETQLFGPINKEIMYHGVEMHLKQIQTNFLTVHASRPLENGRNIGLKHINVP